jgi:hypothetical protein
VKDENKDTKPHRGRSLVHDGLDATHRSQVPGSAERAVRCQSCLFAETSTLVPAAPLDSNTT